MATHILCLGLEITACLIDRLRKCHLSLPVPHSCTYLVLYPAFCSCAVIVSIQNSCSHFECVYSATVIVHSQCLQNMLALASSYSSHSSIATSLPTVLEMTFRFPTLSIITLLDCLMFFIIFCQTTMVQLHQRNHCMVDITTGRIASQWR